MKLEFQTPEDLIDQLDKDKQATQEYLEQHPDVIVSTISTQCKLMLK